MFRDTAETPELEGTTLPLPIHKPPTKREAKNKVSEDTLETLSESEVNIENAVSVMEAEDKVFELEDTVLQPPGKCKSQSQADMYIRNQSVVHQ